MGEDKDPKAILAEAVKKRDDLNIFIRMYQELLGIADAPKGEVPGVPIAGTPPPSALANDPLAVVYPGMFFGKSQPQAVRLFLEQVKPRPMKTRILVDALEKGGAKVGGKNPSTNLWGVLHRNSSDFILVPRAGWGLTEWYDATVIAKFRREGAKDEDEDKNGSEETGK